jgi:uncharacterized protein (DUF1015 family)
MAEVVPFKGVCYSERLEAEAVVAPPYDIISPELREALYMRSPFNIARVDAGKDFEGDSETENKYTRAAALLEEWSRSGALRVDEKESFYAYRMDYETESGDKSLLGFFGLLKLEPLGEGVVYPHECTHSRARKDRLKLLRATRTNTSPIFSVYESPRSEATAALRKITGETPPRMRARGPEGSVHSLWSIADPRVVESLKADLAGKPVFIADGHHRYETALENQRLTAADLGLGADPCAPFNYVLMFLANASDEELTILPTHRLVETEDVLKPDAFREFFTVEELSAEASDITQAIRGGTGTGAPGRKKENVFGLLVDGRQYRLAYKGNAGFPDSVHPILRALDVVVLQELIINRLPGLKAVHYEMDPREAKKKVRDGSYGAAFVLNPTDIRDVIGVALSGQRMPPKSTYFYPKVMAGFVMSRF